MQRRYAAVFSILAFAGVSLTLRQACKLQGKFSLMYRHKGEFFLYFYSLRGMKSYDWVIFEALSELIFPILLQKSRYSSTALWNWCSKSFAFSAFKNDFGMVAKMIQGWQNSFIKLLKFFFRQVLFSYLYFFFKVFTFSFWYEFAILLLNWGDFIERSVSKW